MRLVNQSTSFVLRSLQGFFLLAPLLLICPRVPASVRRSTPSAASLAQSAPDAEAESELATGVALTHKGEFTQAIPHLLSARGKVADEYAVNFDLALCYVATSQYEKGTEILDFLKNEGHATAEVNDLLAQAYIGLSQPEKALATFQRAAEQNPGNEKLYLLMADSCMEGGFYTIGTEVLNMGLGQLPQSARMHYERGLFLSFEDRPDLAKADYDLAAKLAPGTDISYMALGQAALLEGNIPRAIEVAREGIRAGHENYILLTIFGDAVARSNAAPGDRVFAEAQQALGKAASERPDYAPCHLALGELYLAAGRLDDAVVHLEKARQLAPQDAAIYSHLAIAYRRQGRLDQVQQVLAILSKLNQQQEQKYKTDSPNKPGYIASGRTIRSTPQ